MSGPDDGGLAALGPITQETDANNPSVEQQQQQHEEAKQATAAEQGAKDWGMIMFMVGGMACMIAPELKPVYSQDRCIEWGEHANQVAEKYGWNSPAGVPELALLASTASFAVPTFFLVREKLREMKEGKAAGLMAKVGIWWRSRQAKKAGQAAPAADGAADGGN